jgi:hypothetical protein
MMEPRIHFEKYAPEALRAMYSLERHLIASSLGEGLLHLVKMRASHQWLRELPGHAFQDARAHGETEQRLYGLNAWRETPFTRRASKRRSNGQKRSRWWCFDRAYLHPSNEVRIEL